MAELIRKVGINEQTFYRWPKQNSSSNAGGRNTMGVVLTGLSMTGRQANSPVSTRLAAHSLQPKPVED